MAEQVEVEKQTKSKHLTFTVTEDDYSWLQTMPRAFNLSKILRSALKDYRKCAEEGTSPDWLKE